MLHDDAVNQAAFLAKYGGMAWCDPDNDNCVYTASSEEMMFSRTCGSRGYCVMGLKDAYDPDDIATADEWDAWVINDDLFGQIEDYYRNNPQDHIEIIAKVVASKPQAKAPGNHNEEDDSDSDRS